MTNINGIINEVLIGERELDYEFEHDFYERDWMNEAATVYIGHFVEGFEGDDFIRLYFPEQVRIIEARNLNRLGELSDEEMAVLLDEYNGLDDRFNYDKVVAYSDIDGLHWL